MKYDPLPVTPKLVTWARTRAGFTIEEAAKDFASISDWESGKGGPSYPQLEAMADKFKVPVAVFFFPEEPKLPSVSESFRTLPEAEFARLPRRVHYLLRKAKALQLNLRDLTSGTLPANRSILLELSAQRGSDLAGFAATVRQFLGVTVEDQSSWSDAESALKNWRQRLYQAGVFVFKDAFKQEGFFGFCLYDRDFPLIYVNNSSTKSRQIFTLFHELAHLLFETSGIDVLDDDYIDRLPENAKKIEIICNRFAAELLMPDADFVVASRGMQPSEATASLLAERYHVSREVVFRRFLDKGRISQATYEAAAKRWKDERKTGSSGGNPYWTLISYLGREYIDLAYSQYARNRITESELAEFLNTKPRLLGTLEEYLDRGAA